MARAFGSALLVTAALVSVSAADDRPPTTPTAAPVFPVGLDLVNVSVSVRDPQGRLITDLTKDDFVLTEDGRRQEIQVFGRAMDEVGGKPWLDKAMAIDLGILFDTSESMLKVLKLSQEAASRFLEAIPRAHELFTIFFDEEIRVSRYDSENQQGLFERIFQTKGGGNTALYDAMAVYLSRVHGGSGRKVLVLFTDGDDTRSTLNVSELLPLIRSTPVVIYAIAFSGEHSSGSLPFLRARAFLQQVTDMTGGAVFAPQNSKDLPGIYDKILEELSAQYVIGFVSTNGTRDGKIRKLKVDVGRPGLKVRHRPAYNAPGPT
jgi:Ca-activated chloride channel homolog